MTLPRILERLYSRLDNPGKIQDYLNSLPANFEIFGETCHSPLRVVETQTAHCMEGAMLAASIMRFHGHRPLLLDLRAEEPDLDHVVALFKARRQARGGWGAISKTNHAVLRYREPIYATVRELVMSYFHEYFDNATGRKTLREYSVPFDLCKFDFLAWEVATDDLWAIDKALDKSPHLRLLSSPQVSKLRLAELIEIKAGEILEWPMPKPSKSKLLKSCG